MIIHRSVKPTATGVREATVTIRSDARGSPHRVRVNGMGIVDMPPPPPPPPPNGQPPDAEAAAEMSGFAD